MTHYRLSDSMPSAIILARNPRTSSLDELKAYQGNDIFLNNGDEFQIRLFNPLTEKIGAQVSINGKTSNHSLVLNPGEDVVIDRFIDEQRRMIFETYQYDSDNKAAKKAVVNNGLIDIKFFKEYFPNPTFNNYNYSITTNAGPGGYSTLTSSLNGMTGLQGPAGSIGTSGNIGIGTQSPHNQFYSAGVYNCSLDFASDYVAENLVKSSKLSKKSLKETGRVTKGAQSDQNFKNVDVQFESLPFHTILYHLKPMSEKRDDLKEIRQYCECCRFRIKNSNWMYCPKCGNRL